MYQIKQIPTDFVVKEISNFKIKDKGQYLILKLKKENYNTLDAIKVVAQKLHIPTKDIGFAGSKDKRAITEQMISIKIGHHKEYLDSKLIKEKIKRLELRDIALEFLGYASEPITLGDLVGNHFEIVIRNLSDFSFKTPGKITNYFGEQRFGGNNIEIGKSIIKKDFQQACELIATQETKEHLARKKNDFVGAIRLIPKRLLRLYVNAYQSYLWNRTVKELVQQKLKIDDVPLIGFATEFSGLPDELKKIIKNNLEKEQIELTDFIIKQIPNLSLEGSCRKVFVEVKNFKVLEKENDDLNSGKKKIKICFTLPKGSYATIVIKELF